MSLTFKAQVTEVIDYYDQFDQKRHRTISIRSPLPEEGKNGIPIAQENSIYLTIHNDEMQLENEQMVTVTISTDT